MNTPWIEEETFIAPLLASSKPFQRFYSAERKKIGPVYFQYIKGSFHTDGQAEHDIRGTGEETAILRTIKIQQSLSGDELAFTVAHEYSEFILTETIMGGRVLPMFHAVKETKFHLIFAEGLSSAVRDPIINDRLQRYGFNSRAKMLAYLHEQIPPAVGGAENALLDAVGYTARRLQADRLGARQEGRDFDARFALARPTAVSIAREIYLAASKGYDTPPQQLKFFNWFLDRFFPTRVDFDVFEPKVKKGIKNSTSH